MTWRQQQNQPLAMLLLARLVSLAVLLVGVLFTGMSGVILWPVPQLGLLFSSMFALSVLGIYRVKASHGLGRYEIFAQVTADLVFFTIFLYYTGGQSNPFVMLLIPLVAMASMLLVWQQLLVFVAMAVVLVGWVSVFNLPLRLPYPDMAGHLHLLGMGANFLLTLAVIAAFVGWLAASLRKQQAALQRATRLYTSRQVRDEFGYRSAAVLHELGGPVSTLKIALEDWLEEARSSGHTQLAEEDLHLIEASLARIETSIDKQGKWLKQVAGKSGEAGFTSQAVLPLMKGWVADWQNHHPSVKLMVDEWQIPQHVTLNPHAASLLHTVFLVLLDNAFQASEAFDLARRWIEINVMSDTKRLAITIINPCQALAPEFVQQLGKQPVDSEGTGIGLFLARQLVAELGANIQLNCLHHTVGGPTFQVDLLCPLDHD